MITQWQSGETIVGRLRVKGARVDPAIAQLRLATLLNNAVSHPAALPPSAIVFIRKLGDPLPHSIRLQQYDLGPSAAWQQALEAKLESLVSSAARPALGAVPANAEAVVFLDRSELLSSLASDWCEGRVATRWWWQNLLKKTTASQIVRELWRSAPEYVPAAFDKLARSANAATFLKTLSDAEVDALLNSVMRKFRLDDLTQVLAEIRSKEPSPLEKEENLSRPRSFIKTGGDVSSVTVIRTAPWKPWVRESEMSGLRPVQQTFLGIVLMIQRAPAKVRARTFAGEVETWHREVIAARPVGFDDYGKIERQAGSARQTQPRPRTSAARTKNTSSVPLNREASTPEEFSSDSTGISPDAGDPIGTEAIVAVEGSHEPTISHLDKASAASPHTATPSQPELLPSSSEQSLTITPPERKWTNSNNSFITNELPTATPDQLPLIEFQTTTEFGGVFYLVNLGIYLGFYGDFTTPQEPGIDLNIWDFVALLGREFLGSRIQVDPVWKLLERLAGRAQGEEPGGGFEPNIRDWLHRLMPSVRVRLQSALGLSEVEDAGTMLCEQPARVSVTPTHVDVLFALADLPIQIRFAGLDRDPGWLPAAGRFINFHFE